MIAHDVRHHRVDRLEQRDDVGLIVERVAPRRRLFGQRPGVGRRRLDVEAAHHQMMQHKVVEDAQQIEIARRASKRKHARRLGARRPLAQHSSGVFHRLASCHIVEAFRRSSRLGRLELERHDRAGATHGVDLADLDIARHGGAVEAARARGVGSDDIVAHVARQPLRVKVQPGLVRPTGPKVVRQETAHHGLHVFDLAALFRAKHLSDESRVNSSRPR